MPRVQHEDSHPDAPAQALGCTAGGALVASVFGASVFGASVFGASVFPGSLGFLSAALAAGGLLSAAFGFEPSGDIAPGMPGTSRDTCPVVGAGGNVLCALT